MVGVYSTLKTDKWMPLVKMEVQGGDLRFGVWQQSKVEKCPKCGLKLQLSERGAMGRALGWRSYDLMGGAGCSDGHLVRALPCWVKVWLAQIARTLMSHCLMGEPGQIAPPTWMGQGSRRHPMQVCRL